MEYDLNKIVEKMVYDYLSGLLPLIEAQKVRFTPDDIAERYGVHRDTARHMMNRGDFGEVINVTERNKVVTLEGLLKYEERRKGFVSGLPQPKAQRTRGKPQAPGRI